MNSTETELKMLRRDVAGLKDVLGTLIAWMPQSSVSPINVTEAEKLLGRLAKVQQEKR